METISGGNIITVAITVGIIAGLWVLFQLVRGVVKFIWEIKDRKNR